MSERQAAEAEGGGAEKFAAGEGWKHDLFSLSIFLPTFFYRFCLSIW
jgi:hypothetical protein